MNFPRCRGIHADTLRNDQPPELRADSVLANGSMYSNQSGEGDIRRALIEADLLDCRITLPGQLFFNSLQIRV
jgi:type I restriction-modification system DNA methylase subunit